MSKQSVRIFQEMPLIRELLTKAVEAYNPTGDDSLDPSLKVCLLEDVPGQADTFVTCLYAIAQDMDFGEWNDFWVDMGIRIFDAENEFRYEDLESTDDETNEF
jgi:hypothetical protein